MRDACFFPRQAFQSFTFVPSPYQAFLSPFSVSEEELVIFKEKTEADMNFKSFLPSPTANIRSPTCHLPSCLQGKCPSSQSGHREVSV